MCAIVGAVIGPIHDRESAEKVDDILAFIMQASRERGRDGYGYELRLRGHDGDASFMSRKPGRDIAIEVPKLAEIGQSFDKGTFVCNFRAEPTTEYVEDKKIADQQPYHLDNWAIAHNGTIANDRELRTQRLTTSIDSAAIVEQLAASRDPESYRRFCTMVEKLKGSFAILASDAERVGELYIAANYRPVWYLKTDVGTFFASAAEYLPRWAGVAEPLEPYSVALFTHGYQHTEQLVKGHTGRYRALVVASGGMDSTVAAKSCMDKGMDIKLIHFMYGCRAEGREVTAIRDIADELGVEVEFFNLPIYKPGDSKLFDTEAQIAGGEEGSEFAHEWVPARNLVMLSVATAYAEANGFDYIVLGNNLEEAGAYPDNEPEFIRRFNLVLPFAVGDGKSVRVLMPVGNLMKHEIVSLGTEIGAPLDKTWSCYRQGEKHCGTCGPCYMRRKAFDINNIPEVIEYEA